MGLRKSIKKTTKLPVSWNDKSAKQLPFLEKRKRVTSLSIFGKEKFDIIDAFFFYIKSVLSMSFFAYVMRKRLDP